MARRSTTPTEFTYVVNLVNLPDLLCVELVMARGETCCNLPITSKNSTD